MATFGNDLEKGEYRLIFELYDKYIDSNSLEDGEKLDNITNNQNNSDNSNYQNESNNYQNNQSNCYLNSAMKSNNSNSTQKYPNLEVNIVMLVLAVCNLFMGAPAFFLFGIFLGIIINLFGKDFNYEGWVILSNFYVGGSVIFLLKAIWNLAKYSKISKDVFKLLLIVGIVFLVVKFIFNKV